MTIISANHNFCFIHIQKCGGTSIEVEWSKYIAWGDFVIGSTLEGEQLQHVFKTLYDVEKHMSANRLSALLGTDHFRSTRTMALIREPLAIIESEYRFAVAQWGELLRSFVYYNGHEALPALEHETREALRLKGAGRYPSWWLTHNRGTIPDAILADDFGAFLECVADDRWHNYLGKNVTDANGQIIVRDTIKLEEPQRILAYFHKTLGLPDFSLLHENPGARMPLEWPANLRRKFLEICGEDYERFGYRHEAR